MRPRAPVPGSRAGGTRAEGESGGNRLLFAMPRPVAAQLRAALEPIHLEPGQVLVERGQFVEHAIFPDSGIVSMLAEFAPGRRVEVALVGREGLLGLSALLGARYAMHQAVVQVGGEGRRLPAEMLRSLLHGSMSVRSLLLRYAALRLAQAATGVACNALHPLRERAARRLLEIQDRAGPGFLLTQELLADMLGARRPTVNAVLQDLKAEGLLATARGRIAITDPVALEAAACECRQRLRGAGPDFLSPGQQAGDAGQGG